MKPHCELCDVRVLIITLWTVGHGHDDSRHAVVGRCKQRHLLTVVRHQSDVTGRSATVLTLNNVHHLQPATPQSKPDHTQTRSAELHNVNEWARANNVKLNLTKAKKLFLQTKDEKRNAQFLIKFHYFNAHKLSKFLASHSPQTRYPAMKTWPHTDTMKTTMHRNEDDYTQMAVQMNYSVSREYNNRILDKQHLYQRPIITSRHIHTTGDGGSLTEHKF